MIYSVHNLGFESLINTGGSVLFQDGVLFGIASVKLWPISAHFGYFVANLRTFWCTFYIGWCVIITRYEDLVILVFMLLLTMSPINRTQDQMMVLMLNVVVLMLFGVFWLS